MKNFVQDGAVVTLVAPYAVASGAGAQVGALFGVATGDIANGVEGEFATEGVYDLAKTSAQAWTQGQKIYWDNSNKRCDSDGTVGILIGVALAVAANPSATGTVKLNEAVVGASEGPQAAIASLTDSTGGAATDTLAAATNTHAITDSTGGTASTTSLANLADGTTYATDHAAIENNFATIAAELALQRALNTVLIDAIASLAAKDNAMLAALRTVGVIAAA